MDEWIDKWVSALSAELDSAHELRRTLHQNPRLSGDESDTTKRVGEAMGISITPIAETGGWGRIGPTKGQAIAIRGELDALPVKEQTGLDWASTDGNMHACGHDVHLAALTAVTRAAQAVDLPYGLVPVLQPREEAYPSGALDIRESGLFDQQNVAHAIGVHVHPGVDLGAVSTGSGFVNADASELDIHVRGKGGHGAYPHLASDVVAAISHIASGIADVVRRTSDPMQPALVSVGTIQAGNGASNVLPETGRVFATLRTTSTSATCGLVHAVRTFVTGQAESFGCEGTLTHTQGEPALINDEKLAPLLDAELEWLGLAPTTPMRSLGADDFSFFSDVVPSVMCFVGVESAGRASLHDATFLPDDGALERVAKSYIAGYVAAAKNLMDK